MAYKELSAIINELGPVDENAAKTVKTGFSALNSELDGGLFPGLSVIGAAPEMGQFIFLISLAVTNAKKGVPVLIFTAEMTEKELSARIMSRETIVKGAGGKPDKTGAVSVGRLMSGTIGESDRKKLEKAKTSLDGFHGNICVVSGTDCDIFDEIKNYIEKKSVVPLVVINELRSFRHDGKPVVGADNMTLLSGLAVANDMCIAASCTLDINSGTRIDRETFRNEGISVFKADYLFAAGLYAVYTAGSAAPEPAELRRQENADPKQIELIILKRKFGTAGKHFRFDLMSKYSFVSPHTEIAEKRKFLRLCYYNNSNLSANIILSESRADDLNEEQPITENMGKGSYTLSAATDDGAPVTFGGETNGLLFDYYDIMLSDAIYTIIKTNQKKKTEKIRFASIYSIISGDSGARVTDRRLETLFRSITKLALTNVSILFRKRNSKAETTFAELSCPLLPLSGEQTEKLREWYKEYKERSKQNQILLTDIISADRSDTFSEKSMAGGAQRRTYFISLGDKTDDLGVVVGKKEMPLFGYAGRINHIFSYPAGLLDIPYRERSTDRFERLRHFLIKRLEWIRYNFSPENSGTRLKDLHKIMFFGSSGMLNRIGLYIAGVYDEPTVPDDMETREAVYRMVSAILDYYTDIGYIFGYVPYYGDERRPINSEEKVDLKDLVGVMLLPEDDSESAPVYVNDPFRSVDWSRAEDAAKQRKSQLAADDIGESGESDMNTDR